MDNLSPEQIQQMIAMLQSMLPKEQNKEESKKDEHIQQTIKTKNPNRQKREFVNRFDEMLESGLHKDDIEIDKALTKHAPTPRMRKYVPLDVKCRVCGKTEQVNPALLSDSTERYKCNVCSRSAG